MEGSPTRGFLDATHVTDRTKDNKLQLLALPGAELDAALTKARAQARKGKD